MHGRSAPGYGAKTRPLSLVIGAVAALAFSVAVGWFLARSAAAPLAAVMYWAVGLSYAAALLAALLWRDPMSESRGNLRVAGVVALSALGVIGTFVTYREWEARCFEDLEASILALGNQAARFEDLARATEEPQEFGAAAPAAAWLHGWTDSAAVNLAEFQHEFQAPEYDTLLLARDAGRPELLAVRCEDLRQQLKRLRVHEQRHYKIINNARNAIPAGVVPGRYRQSFEECFAEFADNPYWRQFWRTQWDELLALTQYLEIRMEHKSIAKRLPGEQGSSNWEAMLDLAMPDDFTGVLKARRARHEFLSAAPPLYRLFAADPPADADSAVNENHP